VPGHLDASTHVPLVGGMVGSVKKIETALAAQNVPVRVQRLTCEEIEL
jgi:hypothetical protein